MKAILNFFWGIVASIFLILFLLVLSLTPSLLSLSNLITNRQTVINWIDNSDIYQVVIDNTIKQTNDNLKEQGLSKTEISAIQNQIKKAINQDFVKSIMVNLINGVYDWLEGKTDDIEIKAQEIDIKTALTSFIPQSDLGSKDFMKLLNSLKPCTEAQAYKYEKEGGFKSVEDFCIPPKLDLIQITKDSYNQNISDKAIKVDNIFNIPEIPQEQAKLIKDVYSLINNLEWYIVGLLAVLAILFLLFSQGNTLKYYILPILSLINSLIQLILVNSTDFLTKIANQLLTNALPTDIPIKPDVFFDLSNTVLNEIIKGSYIYLYIIIAVFIIFLSVFIIFSYFKSNGNSKISKNPKK